MEKRFPTPALDNTHRHVYNYVYLYGCLGYAVQQLSDTKLRQYYFSCTSLYAMDQYSVCINNNRLIHKAAVAEAQVLHPASRDIV